MVAETPDFSSMKAGPVLIGNFLNAVIAFLLKAIVVYFVIVKPFAAMMALCTHRRSPMVLRPPNPVAHRDQRFTQESAGARLDCRTDVGTLPDDMAPASLKMAGALSLRVTTLASNQKGIHMRLPTRRLKLLVSFGALAVGSAWADQIVLKDGDRVTGSIVKKDGQTVTIDSKNFGSVTLKWDDVATIIADQPLTVVLQGNQTVKSTIQTQNGRIQVGTGQSVAPNEVVALRNDAEQARFDRLLHPGLLDLWTITGSINLAGTKGNAETSTITTPFNFVRASNTSRTTAYFNSIRSTATVGGSKAQTAQAVRGGWGYSRNLTSRVFANGFNDNEYDKFQSLDLRIVLGGGLGYQVWKAESGRLSVVGGAAWNREKFSPVTSASFTRKSAEAYWGNDFNYKVNARTTLVQSFRMFNNLTTTGQYRINFDVGANTQLMKWLTWNVAISDRHLSNPVPGRKTNDLLYTTGLGFSFAR